MKRHQLISSLLLIGMLAGYWFLLARGELAEIRTVQAEVRTLRATLSERETAAARFEAVQGEVDEASRWLEQVQEFYATEGTAPEFLLEVAATLRACGLTPRETTPGSVQEGELLSRQGIRVVVQGTLDDVFEFIHRMEEGRPLCRATDMRLEPVQASGEIRAVLTMVRLWREV